ncbi:MAG: hypothetical protein ACLT8E_09970 [Akkermansia sp.]
MATARIVSGIPDGPPALALHTNIAGAITRLVDMIRNLPGGDLPGRYWPSA